MSDTEPTESVHDEDAKSNTEENPEETPADEAVVIDDEGAAPDDAEEAPAEAEPEADDPPAEDADEAEANAEDAEEGKEWLKRLFDFVVCFVQPNLAAEEAAEGEAEAEAEPEEAEPENPLFKKAFSMFDLDESGEISAGEFGTVMRALGENPTDEDIEELLKVLEIRSRPIQNMFFIAPIDSVGRSGFGWKVELRRVPHLDEEENGVPRSVARGWVVPESISSVR